MMESFQQRLQQATVEISGRDLGIQDLKTAYVFSGWAVMFALVLLDLLTLHVPQAGLLGVILWYVSYLYVLIFAALCLRDLFSPLWPLKAPVTTLVIVAYFVIVAVNMTDLRSMSGETAGETGCAVNLLLHAADHGFQGGCLYGYPARQFFLPAVPTLLFGRSILDLNLGGSFYVLLGIIIFSTGVLKTFRYSQAGDLFAGIFLVSLLHIYFFNHFLLVYEQSLYPISFGLIAAGLFLHYRAQRSDVLIMLGGVILLYLIHSYTPSLAIYGLGLLVLAYLAITNMVSTRDKALFLLLAMLSLASFRLSLLYRQDLHLVGSNSNGPVLAQQTVAAFDHLVFLNHGTPLLTPIFTFPFVFFMVSALLFTYGRGPALIAGWAVLTIVFAIVSHGFLYYGIDFRLHRSMVIFPILFATAALILARFEWQPSKMRYLSVLLFLLALTGLMFHFDIRQSVAPSDHLALLEWMDSHVALTHESNVSADVYFYPGAYYAEYGALNDDMRYFYPQLFGTALTDTGAGKNCLADTGKIGVFVIPTSDPCYGSLRSPASGLVADGVYKDLHGLRLGVFERD